MTDATAPYAITVDPDGVTDESAVRESAADHQDEMHPADAVLVVDIEADTGKLLAALTEARADAARSETCATEAAREADELREQAGLVEGQEQAIAAADADRDRLRSARQRARAVPELRAAAVPPLYPPRVEWVVQVHEPEAWEAEPDGWEQVGPAYPTREDAHARAARRRAGRGGPQVRVVAVARTYTLDALADSAASDRQPADTATLDIVIDTTALHHGMTTAAAAVANISRQPATTPPTTDSSPPAG